MGMTISKREYYIDNVRTLIILSLFIVHACEIYHIGDGFYIEGPELLAPTLAYSFFASFIMSVLFFFAGNAAVFSLHRRGIKGFYLNRCAKLLLPAAVGMATFLPLTAWFVLKSHFDFQGNFLDACKYYFTHCTDFYGYDGALAPYHLWFLIYLFAISLVCFPLVYFYDKLRSHFADFKFGTKWLLLLMPTMLLINYGPGDEEIPRFLLYFILGIILAENQSFSDYLEKKGKIVLLTGIIINIAAAFLILRIKEGNIFTFAYLWRKTVWTVASVLMTLGSIAMGKIFLNNTNKIARFFSKQSFLIYYFHMSFLIASGYFALKLNIHYALQILFTIATSFVCAVIASTICAALAPSK
ncbi:MAG: acyltransferase [Treponema sp.]|nr:acyltransferase [Treponema sp.]